MRLHCQPVLAGRSLLFELSLESCSNIAQSEGTNGRAADGVGSSSEDAIHDVLHLVTIASSDQARDVLDLIKVERIVAGNRAVEPRLEERGPLGVKAPGSPEIILANSSNS